MIIDYIINNDMNLLNEISANEFKYEYLILEYAVFNTGVVWMDAVWTNDLEDYPEQSIVYYVEDLNYQLEELKQRLEASLEEIEAKEKNS